MLRLQTSFRLALLMAFTVAVMQARSADAQVPSYQINVTTDKQDAMYEVGQEAVFRIQVTSDQKEVKAGTIAWVVDDFLNSGQKAGLPEGSRQLTENVETVRVQSSAPAFLRCQVTYTPPVGKAVRAVAAAAFSPEKIQLSLPVPDDFDAWWDEQKQQLAKIPADAELTPVTQKNEDIHCFDVQVPCLGGAPVSGYFAKPKDAAAESLPAILWVHGAGVRTSSLTNAIKGANAGMLSLDINAHGLPNGRPPAFYAEQSSGPLKDYRIAGRESRDTIYFRGMFLRLVRAIDFLTSQPEWNGKHVVVFGHSQGGGQALAAGGLDPRVTLIAPGVPAICDHSGQAAGRVNGWPKLVPNDEDGRPNPQILEAARYVDAVNFATRCKAEAIMSVGFVDAVCPPSSCYAAWNALSGPKKMVARPLMGHAAPPDIQEEFFQHVLRHVHSSPKAETR